MEWESLVLPSSLVGMGTHVNHNSSNFVCVSQLSDMIYELQNKEVFSPEQFGFVKEMLASWLK